MKNPINTNLKGKVAVVTGAGGNKTTDHTKNEYYEAAKVAD